MRKTITYLCFCLLLTAAGCSTTKRLGADEVLYVGVKHIEVVAQDGKKPPHGVESQVKDVLSAKPNNPLFSPYVRTPLPTGLWAYNYLHTDKTHGFRSWLYKRLAKDPVLINDVQPDIRLQMAGDVLENNGYFGAAASYELLPRKNPKKAKVSYHISLPEPYRYRTVEYPRPTDSLMHLIDSLHASSNLREGERFSVDSMVAERSRISDLLRNRGYYYFRPEYIEFVADTTSGGKNADLRLTLRPGIPAAALRPYRIGKVDVIVQAATPGEWDTVRHGEYFIAYQKPLKIKPGLLTSNFHLHSGDLYTVRAQNRTIDGINRLGVFRYTDLGVTPLDSIGSSRTIDITLSAAMDIPLESSFEADITSKSNSYLGPGATFGVSNKNLFHGGELLSLTLDGEYEWQTGNTSQTDHSTPMNSYNFGLTASLSVPRPWLPQFVKRGLRYPASTSLQTGIQLLNRPGFFQMLSVNTSMTYNFQSSRYSTHALTPIKLVYNNLIKSSASFDQQMADNPAVALSFEDQFIPSIVYAYTFDHPVGHGRRNRFFFQGTATSAGNILSPVMGLLGYDIPRKLFGNQFSQFIKGLAEVRFYQHLGRNNTLAMRLLGGIGYAYGNSTVIPYSEQFYSGGANSIRAFSSRAIGPGSYIPPPGDDNGYFDQTGDIRLEANAEFRFKIFGRLGGAVFLDAGNVWLLNADPSRPGGEFSLKTLPREIALGTGAGLRYDISYLVLRVDMGIVLHSPDNPSGKTPYYNAPNFGNSLSFNIAIGYPF